MTDETRLFEKAVEQANKTWTTEAKRYFKRGSRISLERLRGFWKTLYDKHLSNCSYETLEYEAILFFGTNEPRVLEKYIGRPKKLIRYSGSNIVRINMNTGNVAKFRYMNERVEQSKRGLAEIYGWMSSYDKENRVILHHENQEYFTVQTALFPSESNEKPNNVLKSKANLCVHPIQAFNNGSGELPLAGSTLEAPCMDTVEQTEREREYRQRTQISEVKVNTGALVHQVTFLHHGEPTLPRLGNESNNRSSESENITKHTTSISQGGGNLPLPKGKEREGNG